MFYFNVYFRSFIGKIVYKSAVLDCLNSHVQHLLGETIPLAGFTMRFTHTEHEKMVFCGVCAFIYIKGVDKKGTNHETRDDYDDAWYGCGACRV